MNLTATINAVADPTRRSLLDHLKNQGPKRAGDLADLYPKISRPAVSKHLRILKQAGLVSQVKQGREQWYLLDAEPLEQVQAWVGQYEHYWKEKLQDLKTIVESKEK